MKSHLVNGKNKVLCLIVVQIKQKRVHSVVQWKDVKPENYSQLRFSTRTTSSSVYQVSNPARRYHICVAAVSDEVLHRYAEPIVLSEIRSKDFRTLHA